jgi:hypothetical protein
VQPSARLQLFSPLRLRRPPRRPRSSPPPGYRRAPRRETSASGTTLRRSSVAHVCRSDRHHQFFHVGALGTVFGQDWQLRLGRHEIPRLVGFGPLHPKAGPGLLQALRDAQLPGGHIQVGPRERRQLAAPGTWGSLTGRSPPPGELGTLTQPLHFSRREVRQAWKSK